MSLANLSINVNVNATIAQAALRDVGESARKSMGASSVAVEGFRQEMQTTGATVERASQKMSADVQSAGAVIETTSDKSAQALQKIGDAASDVRVDDLATRVAVAFGNAVGSSYAATQTYLQKTEDLLVVKAKFFAVGIALAAVSVTAATVYGAYRIISGTLGFITGLFTGESYKSASIDQLIALNNQVKDLQSNLRLSAVEASALNDATARLGVNKADYTAAYKAAENAMRSNGAELDRLGVKYKDANGQLLDQEDFLRNVKTALDEYREGWDRNAAAAAIGAGTYEQVSEALRVTQTELQASKERLDEYALGFGPERQAAVSAYQKAIREFGHEMDLMSQGFSTAIADNIMPALTTLAEFFRDGFPVAVRAFRYSMATVTSLLYGLKTVFDVVADAGIGVVTTLADGFMALATAAVRALKGDMTGAAQALQDGWAKAGKTVRTTIDEIVGDSRKNRDAILLAWGLDDRTQSLAEAKAERLAKARQGKTFTPAPKPEAAATGRTSAYQNYLDELQRTLVKMNESEYASMRLRAAQLAEKEGITDLSKAYQLINNIQRAQSAEVVSAQAKKLEDESNEYAFQTSIMGENAAQQDKLTFARQKLLEVENTLYQAKQSHRPLDAEAEDTLRRQADEAIRLGNAQRDLRNTESRSQNFGVRSALQSYQDSATNAAKNIETVINGSFSRMEDAIVNFAKTGKLSFADLFVFMADEFLRQSIRMATVAAFGSGSGGLASIFSTAANVIFGQGIYGSTPDYNGLSPQYHLATGTNYVPYDGMRAVLHKGEAVVPAQFNPAAGGKGASIAGGQQPISITNQITVQGSMDQRSPGQIAAATLRSLQAGRRNT